MQSKKNQYINLRLNQDLLDAVDSAAGELNLNRSGYVRYMLENSLIGTVHKSMPDWNTPGAMVRGGRPFTHMEGSKEDGLLFTDLENNGVSGLEDMDKVTKWIKTELRHDSHVCKSSSYSLKHMLHADTGVYLTNNQFKDALFLAGYYPEDYTEYNWHYKLALTRYDLHCKNPFYIWAKSVYGNSGTVESDLVYDMERDRDFPMYADRGIILSYLMHHRSCSEAIDIFYEMWDEYVNYCNNNDRLPSDYSFEKTMKNPFCAWLVDYAECDAVDDGFSEEDIGYFLHDISHDEDFPMEDDKQILLDHFYEYRMRYDDGCYYILKDLFDNLWEKYEEEKF